jgi:hypothetical protein
MATLETRISDMEKKAGAGAGGRLDRIRLVGINPDGTEGESVFIKVPPVMKNGNMDFSGFTDAEVRRLARIRILDAY